MKGSRSQMLLLSLSCLLLSCTLVAVGTYALYTDTITVNHHITSGNQQVGFKKVAEDGLKVNSETGLLAEYHDETQVDLATNPEAVFKLDSFVPSAYVDYKFEVKNLGTVAFDYWFTFMFDEGQESFLQLPPEGVVGTYQNKAELFMDQLDFKVYKGDQSLYSGTLLEYYKLETKKIAINSLLVNQTDTVNVKLSFINDEENIKNNYVQSTKLTFDLNLEAVQKVS